MTGPWVSGESLSPSRLNLHAGAATLLTGFSTDTVQGQSGLTVNILSDLSVQNTAAAQRIELGGAPSSTSGLLSLRANSAQTDYLFLQDATGVKSNFLLGLRTGDSNASQVDGLNLYDASDQTMIVRFSSDSVRFYPPIVAPIFDTGGALASTYNAALFLRGSSKESQVQAAINAAAADGIARVYVPASLYPYNAAQISFNTRVQMVREGGEWDVYDIKAYGANPSLAVADTWSTAAWQAAIHGAHGAGGGIVYVPAGTYAISGVTSFRNVTIRGTGGGRHLDATTVSMMYQGSAATTIITLADTPGSGAVVENLQVSATGNINNQGGILINDMTFCLLRGVGISGTSQYGVRIQGGNTAVFNAILDCGITMNSVGSAIDVEGTSTGMDSSPYVSGCFISTDAPTVWISAKSINAGVAPDSLLFTNNRFISGSTTTAIYGLMTNARFIANRFENIGGSLNVVLAPPTGAQAAGEFIGNSYGITGGSLVWVDSATTPSTRFQEITANGIINSVPGTAILPSYSFGSESSLGFYRSGASTVALSYGAFGLPAGSATAPSLNFSSESSLGLLRSGASSLALSYGTFVLPLGSQLNLIGAGGTPIPLRIFESGDVFSITANRNRAGSQDNAAAASWEVDINVNAGTGDGIDYIHNPAGGGGTILASLRSGGEWQIGAGTALLPSFGFKSEQSLGLYRSGASTMALSYGSFNLNQARLVSVRTAASLDSTSLSTNEMAFQIVAGSVATLAIRSGGTIYYFASSASTKG